MLIVVLNGLLGARKNHLDMTEIVGREFHKLDPKPEKYRVLTGRGGSGIVKFKKLQNRIVDGAENHKVLLLIGKSYGGHWCVRLLEKLAEKNVLDRYKHVGLLTVDPSFVLHKMQRKVMEIPPVDWAANIHQYGLRSGYKVGGGALNLAVEGTHARIEESPVVTEYVRKILAWGSAKARC